jgi:predicted amidophosphoribosyltransferase
MPEKASRNDDLTIACPVCRTPFRPAGRRRYCSDPPEAGRQAAWRQRHPTPLPILPIRTPRAETVYECGACETRYLGEQWCPDCQRPCRRIGPGGACPHCGDPVAVADLVELPASTLSPLPGALDVRDR